LGTFDGGYRRQELMSTGKAGYNLISAGILKFKDLAVIFSKFR
jgi:hypothetical protein